MTPRSEFDRRLKAIRDRMEARNLDLLLIYSTPGSLRFGQRGHVMYVSGYEPYFGDTMLLLPRRASLPTPDGPVAIEAEGRRAGRGRCPEGRP